MFASSLFRSLLLLLLIAFSFTDSTILRSARRVGRSYNHRMVTGPATSHEGRNYTHGIVTYLSRYQVMRVNVTW